MVIEHTFVTTLDADKALSRAAAFLQLMGFAAIKQDAFAVDQAEWNHLEMVRGKAGSADPAKCFQSIRMEFDRGRIDLAASISFAALRGFRLSVWSSGYNEPKPTSKRGRPYAALMISAAQTIDDLLTRNITDDQARVAWMQKEAALTKQIKRQRLRNIIIVVLIYVVLFAFVFFVVSRSHR